MRIVFTLICFTILKCITAQDTIYLATIEGKKANKISDARYYKVITKDSTGYEVRFFHMDGTPISAEHYIDAAQSIYDGEYTTYFRNGNINQHGFFKNGNMDGWWEAYNEAGNFVHTRQHFKNNLMEGECYYLYPNGKAQKTETYSNNKLVHFRCYDSTGVAVSCYTYQPLSSKLPDTTYLHDIDLSKDTSERGPEFPGGVNALLKFLQEHVRYPVYAREKNIQGKVVVKFYVDTDGRVKNPEIIRDDLAGYGGSEEALRVISLMPKWKPGSQKGQPVKVYYTLPITFSITNIENTLFKQ